MQDNTTAAAPRLPADSADAGLRRSVYRPEVPGPTLGTTFSPIRHCAARRAGFTQLAHLGRHRLRS